MVCESALRFAGDPDPEGHPLSFHAMTVATEEDLLDTMFLNVPASGRDDAPP